MGRGKSVAKTTGINPTLRTGVDMLLSGNGNHWPAFLQYLKDGEGTRLDKFIGQLLGELQKSDTESLQRAVDNYLKNKENELDSLKKRKQILEGEISTKQAEKENLEREIAGKVEEKKKLEQADKTLVEAETQKQLAEQKYKEAEKQAEADAEQAVKKRAREIEEDAKKEVRAALLQRETKVAKAEKDIAENKLKAEKEIAEKIKKISEREEAVTIAEANIAQKQDQLDAVLATKDTYDRLAESLQKKNDNFKSNQEEIDRLKNENKDLQDKEIMLLEQIRELEKCKADLRNLSLEVVQKLDERPDADDIVAYINGLRDEKAVIEDALITKNGELSDTNEKLRQLTTDKQTLSNELSSYKINATQMQANVELVKVSQSICKNLAEEMKTLKNSLDTFVGDPCRELANIDAETSIPSPRPNTPAGKEISSLNSLVTYVRRYADTTERIYYSEDDICAFVAGLATSNLLILQGMSGTGKSSLPRVFAEALHFQHNLIPVESSWRDRNDLLGYYNDFSRQFNTKDFTKALYRCAKQEKLAKQGKITSVPHFITLDEMNLARIEYYFSDFLSALEKPNPEEWKIPLCTKPLRIDNKGPQYLEDGNTAIHIPQDVWFIGTANRDESTFDITDKVYDRAQVLSLNKKGEKTDEFKQLIDSDYRYVTSQKLQSMFQNAKQDAVNIQQEVKAALKNIDENVLQKHFYLSYGNRIETDAITYASVFIKAKGGDSKDALKMAPDYQIATKIWRKVENSDNIEGFRALSEKIAQYKKSSEIVQKHIEKISK